MEYFCHTENCVGYSKTRWNRDTKKKSKSNVRDRSFVVVIIELSHKLLTIVHSSFRLIEKDSTQIMYFKIIKKSQTYIRLGDMNSKFLIVGGLVEIFTLWSIFSTYIDFDKKRKTFNADP